MTSKKPQNGWSWIFLSAIALSMCLPAITVQAQKESDAEKTLIDKAKALEARGRPDIAVQVWQQILLSDPNNALALEGVARDYRLSGNSSASDQALDKLRRINPSDPNIGRIQGLTSDKTRDQRLSQAGSYAKAGNPDAAMKIYREYYGDHPPDGDIALAYYETLYATPSGKTEALNAMRAAAARNPGDPRFIVTLGRMLTYDPRTRAEGIRILHEHAEDSDAQNSLRQALIWDSANPTSAAELREYLRTHPKDSELESRLKENEGKLAEMNSGIARTPAERAAFAALNAHHLQDAEARFKVMLDANEKDARAAAGMGFLRMQQSNFGGAISYLVQAEQNGFRDRSVVEGLATSRFWFTMGEASAAFDANQLDAAADKYKEALTMRPRSPEALNGLAGVYTKNEQFPEAIGVYQQILKIQPASTDAWRGLFLGYARANQNTQALTVMARFPVRVKTALNRDPDFLRTLAVIYQADGRDADAQRVLAQALALPFPDNGANLKTGTRLQYAGILMAAKRYDQAAELYKQILNDGTDSLPAWMGLVTADHQLGQDRDAIDLVEKMPPATYEASLSDPGFLSMLGSMYQQSNQFEIAQGLLERSAKIQMQSSGQPSLSLQIQLASIYLLRNNTAQAYGLYRQILQTHPDNLDAWRGLIGTLQVTNRNTEALQQIQLIPPAVRKQLEADVQFEQSEASLYAAAGDTVNSFALFNRIQKHYATLHQQPPADVDIQSAYLLYNTKNDRALYPALMNLGARQDLTTAQRETIQGLWANWSVRRSATAFAAGNTARAIDILDAAAQAFPDNLTVRKAVAGGYLTAGKSREALAIFKEIDMQNASAGDFQGAIGSALAASDKAQAEIWLRQALDRFPRDPAILGLAARFEQARGDNARAADYWRASLAVMPQVSPTDKLAHELVNPEQEKSSPHAATPRDLAHLLNPDEEPTPRGARDLPPLPSYGRDPYDGSAPVVLTQQTPNQTPGTTPVYAVPTTTTTPLPASDTIPSGNASSQPSTQQASPTHKKSAASATNYSGRMHPPAANPITPAPIQAPTPTYSLPQRPSQPVQPYLVPQNYQPSTQPQNTQPNLRITSQPMNPTAARAQAMLADQTDGQLTQGLSIRYLSNATTGPDGLNALQQISSPNAAYSNAQYTPSAQDAAAGAYSAQKQGQQPTAPQPVQPAIQQPAKPLPSLNSSQNAKPVRRRRRAKPATTQSVPTLVTAPGETPAPQQSITDGQLPASQPTTTTGLSDQELQNRNLPPLRGPWVRTAREPKIISPREEAETQLRTIEGGYSAWLGGTGIINHRTGVLGYESLTALEAPFEASVPLSTKARLTIIAKPVFLDSGQADGTAVIQLTSGAGPEPFGTESGAVATATPPAQQNAAGLAAEGQLSLGNLALAAGITPQGFLVRNFTGRANWRPGGGPFTFIFNRDSIKDTQLSYAGLRDPGSASAFFPGNVWGGVIANQGNVQYARGDLSSGFYVGAGGQYITGFHVQNNTRFDGSMGAYWRVYANPEYGTLNIGGNFFAMHYSNNVQAFTYGMGGYFSPQAYFLANVPLTWTGHYLTRWHYTILGSIGIQAFQQDSVALYPLDKSIEVSQNNPFLAAKTSVGSNYDLRGQVAYGISDHWFVGGFAGANNSRDYTSVGAGFSIRYLFRSQPSTVAGPTGLFQVDDQHPLRPLMVP
ncbi:cellulose synthase subunit BcsC-related outer membrane protein [Acidicapsa ligni]|uniref:cellulose synthase subunit BcsC-related outer membrane protein n=1 Tax=Acidicapsa ligni TaxID=542300 RepID=UPI0021DFFC59|nr:cellulose synthase subunit BcsC-related outer membrane protein [Acidicapsa ligni]